MSDPAPSHQGQLSPLCGGRPRAWRAGATTVTGELVPRTLAQLLELLSEVDTELDAETAEGSMFVLYAAGGLAMWRCGGGAGR